MADSIIMKTALCGALALDLAVSSLGAQDGVNEVIVTGSYIKQTPEDQPLTPLDLNYDPYRHNPFGQMIKVGVRHKFWGATRII